MDPIGYIINDSSKECKVPLLCAESDFFLQQTSGSLPVRPQGSTISVWEFLQFLCGFGDTGGMFEMVYVGGSLGPVHGTQ